MLKKTADRQECPVPQGRADDPQSGIRDLQFAYNHGMVVRPTHCGWYIVTQPDHAALAGRIAARWSLTSLPAPRDPWFVSAVSLHDSGWKTLDAAPAFDPNGEPISFLHWPLTSAVVAWRHSVEEASRLGE